MNLILQSPSQALLLSQLQTKRKPRGIKASGQSENSFRARLRSLINQIQEDINRILIPELKRRENEFVIADSVNPQIITLDDLSGDSIRPIRERWVSPEFELLAEQLALQFVTETNQINARRVREDLNRFGINALEPDLRAYMEEAVSDNVRLIKSISSQYLDNVESVVSANVRAGNRSTIIAKQLIQSHGVSVNRAKFIARDQTAKLNADLSKRRHLSAGFEYFRWIDSKDIRVRSRHRNIAKRKTKYGIGIYRYDELPLSDSGQPIFPGHDYQCRCIAQPVLPSEIN
ncbi:phage minor head protein [Sessilibacter corallicola]|uniref:phage minor head protein n=1 Tax=Sessilibacter corallicola TaxID=2904075 RepID=UPI001E39DAD6|nr:phage minor head protein [Sessilibacter corallicola]MCE2029282.1 minor capsid protein [Sessilibacter corallicola]